MIKSVLRDALLTQDHWPQESSSSAEQTGTASKPKSLEDGALLALRTDGESGGSSSGGKWTTISGKASAKHLIMVLSTTGHAIPKLSFDARIAVGVLD